MSTVVIGLATYRREREYRSLLDRIRETKGRHDVTVVVVQDGEKCYVEPIEERKFKVVACWQAHNGKFRYWKTVSNLWRQVKALGLRDFVYIQLADDLHLTSSWLTEALRLHRLKGPGAVINLLRCHRAETGNWGFMPQPHGKYLYSNAFIDGCFVMDGRMLEVLNWQVNPIPRDRWRKGKKLGSLVWRQVSDRLSLKRVPMYMVSQPIITTDWSPHLSVMNPDRTPIT